MSVVLYRIDDRLLHGQIITGWLRCANASRVIIADDAAAADTALCQITKMIAPAGVDAKILPVDEALAQIMADDGVNTIVLTKTPGSMRRLLDGGAPMRELNLGGMGFAPGRKAIFRNIQISNDEYDELKALEQDGVKIFCQIVPNGKRVEFSKVKM